MARILYLDPFSGVSGDMFVGALLDLGLDLARLHSEIGKLKLAGYHLSSRRVTRSSMAGTKFDVKVDGEPEDHGTEAHATSDHGHEHGHSHGHDHGHEHGHEHGGGHGAAVGEHRTFADIRRIIEESTQSERVKGESIKVFARLAEAEGRIHNIAPERVTFHEVGALDSIIDIVGVCIGLEALNIDEIHCGPLALGSGTVRCAHGLMPVPAPATLELVKGIPLRSSPVEKELTTPTGAALVAALTVRFGQLTGMSVEKIGYGAGSRDNPNVPNILRVVLGAADAQTQNPESADTIVEIRTNLDDCTPEVIGYLSETLLAAGALDVFATAIQMKKSRPGTLLTVLAEPQQLDAMAAILFRESPSFGLRYETLSRLKLVRRIETVETPYGKVRVKIGRWRCEDCSVHPEFEDCRALAKEKNVPLQSVIDAARAAWLARH
jgi:uncharacterized protein (TIGR00299 family) protein